MVTKFCNPFEILGQKECWGQKVFGSKFSKKTPVPTHSRHIPDNLWRPTRLLADILQTPQIVCLGTPHHLIIPLCGPACKLKTCKNSTQVELQIGRGCGNQAYGFPKLYTGVLMLVGSLSLPNYSLEILPKTPCNLACGFSLMLHKGMP